MNGLEFVARVIEAVAWPCAVVVIALFARPLVREVVRGDALRRLKIGPGGFEAEWERVAAETKTKVPNSGSGVPAEGHPRPERLALRQEMLALMERSSPIAAVLASHSAIDAELRGALSQQGLDVRGVDTPTLANLAFEKGMITAHTRDAVEGLGVMRMLAQLSDQLVDEAHAMEFITIADATLYALRHDISK
ncbi:MAG TPA: hypothetical protein VM938_01825 [Acidimicrobiales bacterium]|nr:hypothetical protein [Acidimicrobiales bacterium]